MSNIETVLSITTLVIMLASFIAASAKNNSVLGSIWSQQEKVQAKFKVDKTKVGRFASLIGVAFVATGLLAIALSQKLALSIEFAAFNTLVLSYPLTFWVLLKEVPKK